MKNKQILKHLRKYVVHDFFDLIRKLMQISAILPVFTLTAGRSFSTLKHKNLSENSTGQECLNSLNSSRHLQRHHN